MGAPKTDLESAFVGVLIDFNWEHYGLGAVNEAQAGWAADLAKDLAWIVRNRQTYVDQYRNELL